MERPCLLHGHSEEPQDLRRSGDRAATDQRMAAVHALGHPNSPAPQTAWEPSGSAQGGGSAVPAVTAAPMATPPNAPGIPALAPGAGSDLIVTWTVPAVDPAHGAATGFALRHGLTGTGTWTIVQGVSSPHELSDLPSAAAIDVQLQARNGGGASMWSATATLTTGVTGLVASSPPATGRPRQGQPVHGVDPSRIWQAAARERQSVRWGSSAALRQLGYWLGRLLRAELWWLARLSHPRRAHHRRNRWNL